MDKQVFILAHAQARKSAFQAVLSAPEGARVEIKLASRSARQNALLHALFSDIACQVKHKERWLTPDNWKVLLISAHSIATHQPVDMVVGLEGELINIRESSAKMTVKRMNSLIEYILAWCAQNNVRVSG